jgi:hypothetical protein
MPFVRRRGTARSRLLPLMPEGTLRRQLPSPSRLVVAVAIGLCLGTVALAVQAVLLYPGDGGYARTDGQLLGGDFLAFYLGGKLFVEDRERLYDLEYQRDYRDELLGADATVLDDELPFVYPPVVAALLAPLSTLTFHRAYLVWVLFGTVVSGLSLVSLMRVSGAAQVLPLPLLLFGCFAFLPFAAQTFLGGQLSWLGVAILATTCATLLRDRDFLSGAILSLSYYKPPLFVFLLIVLVLSRGRRFFLGFSSGATILLTATVAAMGVAGTLDYLELASRYIYGREMLTGMELPTAEGMGLWALAFNVFASMPIALAVLIIPAVLVGMLCVRLLRSPDASVRLYGLVLATSATIAFSLQVLKYDLALLLVPMILAIAWVGTRDERRHLSFLPFLAFYLEFLVRKVQIGDAQYNLSALLFLALLSTLTWQAWQLLSRTEKNTA